MTRHDRTWRRIAVLTLFLGALSAGAAAAQAGGHQRGRPDSTRGGPHGAHGPAFDDVGFGPTLPMLTRMLDLTPEQVRRIEPLRATMLEESREERRQAAAARAAMEAGRRARVGPDSMAVLRDRMQGAMQMLMPPRLRFAEAMKAVLTPEQREKFDAHRAEMMQQMGERMRKPEE